MQLKAEKCRRTKLNADLKNDQNNPGILNYRDAFFIQEKKMETTIKDLILSEEAIIENRPKTKKTPRKPAEYEIVTVSGPDFAVRKKGTKANHMLVCICSKGQFYIRNESTGETDQMDSGNLVRFLNDVPKDGLLDLSDDSGNTPFWITGLDRTRDFAENFMAAVNDETIRQYFCRNMLSFSGIAGYVEHRRKMKYSSPMNTELHKVDFKRAKIVFECAAEIYPRKEVKDGLCECLGTGRSDGKIGSMFQVLLRTHEQHNSHYLWRNTKTVYDWLFDNWGIEGVKQFIRSYLETPVACMPENLESSQTIQKTSFALSEFVDYSFCECTRQGYADSPRNFIQSWDDFLEMQLQVYGKIQKKYSEYLASDETALSYKVAKLQEARQIRNFSGIYNRLRMYEGRVGKYMIIAPKTPKDMIDEGQMQSNCVASYIDRVANGHTMIFFMRLRKEPERSLVTIEVRDNRLVQVKARFNKRPTDEQNEAVETWFLNSFRKPKQVSLLDYKTEE